jgi:hypothetical protein
LQVLVLRLYLSQLVHNILRLMLCIVELSDFITVALIYDSKLVLELHHHLGQPLIIQLKCLGFSIVTLGQLLICLAAVVVFLLPYEH